MKKLLSIILVALLSLCVFCACSSGNTHEGDGGNDPPAQTGPGGTEQDPEQGDGGENKPEEGEQNPPEQGDGEQNPPEEEKITKMYLTVNGNRLEVILAENSAVEKLVEILKEGDIVYTANDYGGFEKVGSLGHSLPTSDEYISTQAGDVMLYLGNQIVIFYGSNSWEYTRLGKIEGYSTSQLATLLGAGQGRVEIILSLK